VSKPTFCKVYPMAANQFEIYHDNGKNIQMTFQSYNSKVCTIDGDRVILHEPYWNMYSQTTNKYLLRFLKVDSINTIREKVKSGEYEVMA